MNSNMQTRPQDEQPSILRRPPDQLHDFPVHIRWEVTRRHPYYLTFWEHALRYRHGDVGTNDEEKILRFAAVHFLGAIGVCGEPVDPAVKFEDLDDVLDPAFLTGSVQPLSLRSTVVMLINSLPEAERSFVAAVLHTSSNNEYAIESDDESRSLQKYAAMLQLLQAPSTVLDSYPDAPLYCLHLSSSQRNIVRDVEELVRREKKKRGIEERRVHTTKLESYLKVWDLREGWTGKGYCRAAEKTITQVTRKLSVNSISSAAKRYLSAFKLITGHDYTPLLWFELFGLLRQKNYTSKAVKRFKRLVTSSQVKESVETVPDSIVTPANDANAHSIGIVESKSAVCDAQESQDLLIDIRELIEKGWSNDRIAEELEICDADLVDSFRKHLDDFA